jgi:hypothetical protein
LTAEIDAVAHHCSIDEIAQHTGIDGFRDSDPEDVAALAKEGRITAVCISAHYGQRHKQPA